MNAVVDHDVVSQLAPNGALRAAVNLSNPLLVTGRSDSGDPVGVSPDMARTVSERIGVPIEYVTFPSPGAVADAACEDRWDIALIAHEPKRAEAITFSPAYSEIEATYLVRGDSDARSHEDLDRPGMRIAVSARSAYDLYLSRTLRNAELVRGEGLAGALSLFTSDGLDALAGLRPALLDDAQAIPGARVLDGCFTTVRQAIGVRPEDKAAAAFVAQLVEELRADGTIQRFIDLHGMNGRLQVGSD
jgi:polar amino acid transport system substrate-binding protein